MKTSKKFLDKVKRVIAFVSAAALVGSSPLSVLAASADYQDADATLWTLGLSENTNGPSKDVQGTNGWFFMYTEETNVGTDLMDMSKMAEMEYTTTGASCHQAWGAQGIWAPSEYADASYSPDNSNWWLVNSDGRINPGVDDPQFTPAYAWEAPKAGDYEFTVDYKAGSKAEAEKADGVIIAVRTDSATLASKDLGVFASYEELPTGQLSGQVSLEAGERLYITVDPKQYGAHDWAELQISVETEADDPEPEEDDPTPDGIQTEASYTDESATRWTMGASENENAMTSGQQGTNGWYAMYSNEINKNGELNISKMKEAVWSAQGSCWLWYGIDAMWMPAGYAADGYDFQGENNWWYQNGEGRLDTNVTAPKSGAYAWAAPADGNYKVIVDYKAGSKGLDGDGNVVSIATASDMIDTVECGAVQGEANLATGTLEGTVALNAGEAVYVTVDPKENGSNDYAQLAIVIELQGGEIVDPTPEGIQTEPTYADENASVWTMGKEENINGPTPGVQGANGWYAMYTGQIGAEGDLDVSKMKEATWSDKGTCWNWYGYENTWMPNIYLVDGYDRQEKSNWYLMDGNGRLDPNVMYDFTSGAYAWMAPADGTYDITLGYIAGTESTYWEGVYYYAGDGVTVSINTEDGVVNSALAPAASEEMPELPYREMTGTVDLEAGEVVYFAVDPNGCGGKDHAELTIEIEKRSATTEPTYDDTSAVNYTLGFDTDVNGMSEGQQGSNGWYALYSNEINKDGALDLSKMKEAVWSAQGSCWQWYIWSSMWMPAEYAVDGYDLQGENNWWYQDGKGRLDTNVTAPKSGAYAWMAAEDGEYKVSVDYKAGSKGLDGDGNVVSIATANGIIDTVKCGAVDGEDNLATGTLNGTVELKAGDVVYVTVDPKENGSNDYASLKINIKNALYGIVTSAEYDDVDAEIYEMTAEGTPYNTMEAGTQGSNGWYAMYSDEINKDGALDLSKMREAVWSAQGTCYHWWGAGSMWMPAEYAADGYNPGATNNWWYQDGQGRLDTNVTVPKSGAYAWAAPADGDYVVTVGYKAGSKGLDGDGNIVSIATANEIIDTVECDAVDGEDNLATGTLNGTVSLKAGEVVYVTVDPKENGSNDYAKLAIQIMKSAPIVIVSQPTDQNIVLGDRAEFSVTAIGTEADITSYQWYYKTAGKKSFSVWSGRTSAAFSYVPTLDKEGMQAKCKITDANGNVRYTDVVTLHYTKTLVIKTQPTDQKIVSGDKATFAVKALGAGLTYQWYFKMAGRTSFSKWTDRTEASFSYVPTANKDGMQVYCKVTDEEGQIVKSDVVTLTFKQAITITKQPTDVTIDAGDKATFAVEAQGDGLKYQWYYKLAGRTTFTAWSGRTESSFTYSPSNSKDGMQVYCKITDENGKSMKSDIVTLTIKKGIVITEQPTDVNIKLGSKATFSVTATGSGLTYQWYYKLASSTKFTKWTGRTDAQFTYTPTANKNGMKVYCVIQSDDGSSKRTDEVTLNFVQ